MWQCHGSPLDKRCWSAQAAEDAVCERSAHVMSSNSGVEVIRSYLSLQTGKYLPGLAGSRPCMPQGRFLTVWFIPYGTRCLFRSFTPWESPPGTARGLGRARVSAPGFGSLRRSSNCPFLWQGFAQWRLNIWTVGVSDSGGAWMGPRAPLTAPLRRACHVPWTMLPFTTPTEWALCLPV